MKWKNKGHEYDEMYCFFGCFYGKNIGIILTMSKIAKVEPTDQLLKSKNGRT